MKKMVKGSLLCLALAALLWGISVFRDRQTLNEDLIRLHVVANSDSQEDQALKLLVRDAVTQDLQQAMEHVEDVHQAKQYLSSHLDQIRLRAENTLAQSGCDMSVTVSLEAEPFDTRHYDTFSLPAGT